ncbi:M6 family metalloprotease domain-containing protein [Streptomyces sp. NPDC052396]|uniref:M6 family metalloprotease domain-containing protein n=1 Tax=Streptomyces sp. NPDC052396 TaxID=3365689 RepID=UPI0037CF4DFE
MRSLAIPAMAATLFALTAPAPAEASRTVPAAVTAVDPTGRRPSGPCALRTATHNVSEGARTPRGFARSSGVVRAATLFIDFPDAPARGTPQQRYAEFFPAVPAYYRASSYGRLDYRSTPLLRWIRMSRPYSAYGIERGTPFDSRGDAGYYALSKEILAAVDGQLDLRHYDLVNVLATPNAGPPATEDVRSVTFAGAPTGLRTRHGAPLKNVSFIWSRQTGDSPYRVLAHENAHSFGLPDLYYTGAGSRLRTPVGHWDPMDEDWGPSNDFLAWHKWKLGWLSPGQVHCAALAGTRTFTLTPTSVKGGPKLVVVPLSATRAVTLEARAPGPLDHAVCRAGILVTTVATDRPSGAGPIRASDATPGSRGCYTKDPNVTASLTDAAYLPGQHVTIEGVTVEVTGHDRQGSWRVKVTRRGRGGSHH